MKEKIKSSCAKITTKKYCYFFLAVIGLFFVINLAWGALPPKPALDCFSLYENDKKITNSSVIVKITYGSDLADSSIVGKKVCCNGECFVEQIYHRPQELIFYKTNEPNLICGFEKWRELHKNQEYKEGLKLYDDYLNKAINTSVCHTPIVLKQPRDQKIRGEVSAPPGHYISGGGGIIGRNRYFNIDIGTDIMKEEMFMYYSSIVKRNPWALILVVLTVLTFIGFFLYKIKLRRKRK